MGQIVNPITYNYSGGVVTYNVTVTGSYDIVAIGAGGGTGFNVSTASGSGAEIGGTFNLTAGQTLNIIVGGVGGSGNNAGGGGGGFTEIYTTDGGGNIVPLLVAGGGGGGGTPNSAPAGNGTVGNSGAGGGGAGGFSTGGGGGAGSMMNGFAGGGGGRDAANGGGGGTAGASGYNNNTNASYAPGAGGFGGGGGGGSNGGYSNGGGGGGGGGYTGGYGGGGGGGEGGTSYLDTARGTQTLAIGGFRAGDGNVIITAPAAPPTPPRPTPTPTPAPCYVTGTRIRVLRGLTIQDVPVEHLCVSDLALTAAGPPRPIRWIGTRHYLGRSAPKADCPVRIKAGALHDSVPARDLLVSPDHALLIDGLFVAAGHLVNGKTITRGDAVADLTYWHVELDSHDMLPAESFLAAPGVRGRFDGAHRADAAEAPVAYALRVEGGPELDALRDRLIVRAGLSIEPMRFGAVRAWMDKCDGTRVAGWVQDAEHPDAPVCLDIVVDGTVVAMTLAEAYRADIAAAGVGDGRHGFDLDLDEPLVRGVAHTVEVRRSADGSMICAMRADAAGVWTALLAA